MCRTTPLTCRIKKYERMSKGNKKNRKKKPIQVGQLTSFKFIFPCDFSI